MRARQRPQDAGELKALRQLETPTVFRNPCRGRAVCDHDVDASVDGGGFCVNDLHVRLICEGRTNAGMQQRLLDAHEYRDAPFGFLPTHFEFPVPAINACLP
jgi:hypothetical protein